MLTQNQMVQGFRLSPQQKRLWNLQQGFQPTNSPYRVQCLLRLTGDLQIPLLQTALEKMIDRHEILRTTFQRPPGIKMPLQVTSDRLLFQWQTLDLSPLTPEVQAQQIEALWQQGQTLSFDWEQGPLLHATLLTLSEQEF